MIFHDHFFHSGFGRVWQEKYETKNVVAKTPKQREQTEVLPRSPFEEAHEAQRYMEDTQGNLEAMLEKSGIDGHAAMEQAKGPMSFLTAARNQVHDPLDSLQNDIETAPSDSLGHFEERHGARVKLPSKIAEITEKTTTTNGLDGLGFAFSFATMTPVETVSGRTHKTEWNPNDDLSATVDLGPERGGEIKVPLGSVGSLLGQQEGLGGMTAAIVGKLDDWWAHEQAPKIARNKPITPLNTSSKVKSQATDTTVASLPLNLPKPVPTSLTTAAKDEKTVQEGQDTVSHA